MQASKWAFAPSRAFVLCLGAGLLAGAACVESGGGDAGVAREAGAVGDAAVGDAAAVEVAAVARLDADVPGLDLAKKVEGLLAGPDSRCKNCHGITRETVRGWAEAMLAVEAACIDAPGLTPAQRVDCLRVDPTSSTSPFSAHKLGLYATGATTAQFGQLFAAAYGGPAAGRAQHNAFAKKVGMPFGGPPLAADDFAAIKSWVLRGMPSIDAVFNTSVNPDATCNEEATSLALFDHLARMKTEGWGARLADLATPMFGCGAATDPRDCLTAQPDVSATFGAPAVAQTVRQLYAHTLNSNFWVRSSADGRYFAFAAGGGRIIDLTQPTKPIVVNAPFDPYFFPSNDGFSFAGSGVRACRQSLIADAMAMASPSISMHEAKCSQIAGGDYQSIGSSLDGIRYYVTIGTHRVDAGGHGMGEPFPPQFGATASTSFTPMTNNGQAYQAGTPVNVPMPGEGDAMLSPSGLLVATRFDRTNGQSAYRVRLVQAEGAGVGLAISTPLVAQVCIPGTKAGFSFDERFLVTHQYVDHDDPDQASLPIGSSNVIVVDLKTGKKTRITKMNQGSYALFPHFRADGWLYYMVRDENNDREYLLATDIALRAAD
jgi:hypothetical protein